MNREILFRGKRLDNREWVEGFYIIKQDPILKNIKHYYIVVQEQDNRGMLKSFFEWYEVDPSTVGQYTGQPDKNGVKIFKGDIVRHYNRTDEPESYEQGVIYWDVDRCQWRRTDIANGCDTWRIRNSCIYEVIGNIYDNPELLEVKP